MWELINRDRAAPANRAETQGQAHPLRWDERLAEVARGHSRDMAGKQFFGHIGADGATPDMRVSRAGIAWRAMAENIAEYDHVARAEFAFMDEPRFQPNHRANILNPNFTHVGVGIVRGADGRFYITQDFAQEP